MNTVGWVALAACSLLACDDGAKKAVDAAPVKVVEVVKGDEIMVRHGADRSAVRLLGVQAFSIIGVSPETTVAAKAATSFLETTLTGGEVTLELREPQRDSFGRYLAYVRHQGVDVNQRLLEQGLAVVYTEFGFDREAQYLSTESIARDAKRGLWQSDATVELVKGLRRQWASARAKAIGKPAPADALLVP